jgi:hypothetical protein
MNKDDAFLLIILISFSFEARMRCFDDLDGAPTEKCYVRDVFNNLRYYDSCKNGKICTIPYTLSINDGSFELYTSTSSEPANYGVCAPLPYGGFEGAVCGDNAECFSNNCDGTSCGEPKEFCKMHSECEKGKYCNNTNIPYHINTTHTGFIEPTNKCVNLVKSGGDCYEDYQCPPLHLCHREFENQDSDSYGKCKKIGSVENEYVGNDYAMLCKTGFQYNGYCVKEASINCVKGTATITTSQNTYSTEATDPLKLISFSASDFCRESLFDGSDIPKVSAKSIKAFGDYVKELNDIDMDPEKKHANYGTIRFHYDKKKVKEALVKAMYYELYDDDSNDQAECLLDSVKQIVLSGEKINFSKILVLAFALLLI